MFILSARSRRAPVLEHRNISRALRHCVAVITAGLLLSLTVTHSTQAQEDPLKDVPQVTQTIAIRHARIVQAPGRVIDRGTVVMRDGLITAVGRDVAIPYDAEIIEGDSLTVYAGFIDGLSHVGLPKQDTPERPRSVNTAEPPQDYAGIQPDRRAQDLLNPDHTSIDALRKEGFTAAHVVPPGRMLPGSGSIVLLSGETPSDMVLRPDVSQFMQFEGGPGVYPATVIGVMAKLRQLYREAGRRKRIELLYAENPAGMERPSYDPIHQALYPVVSREKPLFILTDGGDSALEVHRALSLSEELGFSVALAGLAQGFDVIGTLKDAGVPLFVTLGLPEEAAAEGKVDSSAVADTMKAVTPKDPATFFVSDLRTRTFEDVALEEKNLKGRRAESRRRYVSNAAALHEAGLRFGVSSLGAETKNIRKNIREMIDAGLPEDAALAALTIDGARLLGLERSLGTVETGKLANLVVTDGSYFDEEGEIRFVFVEGRKYRGEEEEESDLSALAGTWSLEIDSPDGPVGATIELSVSGDMVVGRVTSSQLMSPADLSDASYEKGRLTFMIETSEYGEVAADFTVSGDTLIGTVDVPGTGKLDVTGKKAPNN